MIEGTTIDDARQGFISQIHRPPYLGILAFFGVLLWFPIAHIIGGTLHATFPGGVEYLVGGMTGLLGFSLVWKGFKHDELTATCMGLFGGGLIWIGWFEYSFNFFGEFLKIEPLMYDGKAVINPNSQVIEASAVLFLAVLIFTGANKDTRCRMFMWFHRNFRLRPSAPTAGYRRQFSRIAAMEILFIVWFIHIVNITVRDPRVFGPFHPVRYATFGVFLVWGIYLLTFKLLKYRSMAGAIRYAIATTGILWLCVEMAARWGWFTERWGQFGKFPVENSIILSMFILAGLLANVTMRRGELSETS